jgi:hypothetical protein
MTSSNVDHDVPAGKLDRCQVCGATDLEFVIDLGHQPLCNALLTRDMLDQPEPAYPLRMFRCPRCGVVQLDHVVDGSVVYSPDYPYRSGISRPLEIYQRAFADGIVSTFSLAKDSLCVDVGSNDGTLLTGFQRHGMRALGVEPTNIARIARAENHVETIQHFFTEALARDIVRDYGRAAIVTMTNVFAHMASLGQVMRGLQVLLQPNGVFVAESHYLLDILQKNQFDSFYHEHIRSYSLKSLLVLFEFYGLEVFDVERAERYAGNIRCYVARRGLYPVSASVADLLRLEEQCGLHDACAWEQFRRRVLRNREQFMEFLCRAHEIGACVVGNSCPGRASTLLNFYGVSPALMPYIGELPRSLKLDKFLPGAHIPIVDNRRIVEEQPDYLVLLAWHYREPIVDRVRKEGVKAKLVVPLPEFAQLDE